MKASFVIIVLGSWGLMLFFPWWSLVFPCFIAGLIGPDRGYKAFTAGLLAVGGLWLVLALFADFQNGGVLTGQMAAVMDLPVWAVFAGTFFVGAITGAFATLAGYLVLGRGR
ncbi:MAG: hypothetical protein LAT84_14295 [Balneolia bacterium]|nr:hypothetical protein [Balneolia bacterium]